MVTNILWIMRRSDHYTDRLAIQSLTSQGGQDTNTKQHRVEKVGSARMLVSRDKEERDGVHTSCETQQFRIERRHLLAWDAGLLALLSRSSEGLPSLPAMRALR